MQIEHTFYLHNERPPQERESCLVAIDSKAEPKLMGAGRMALLRYVARKQILNSSALW